MNTNKKGEETGRESNNNMCFAGASADTTNNKSTVCVCVHSGLKYDNLNGRCLDIIHYITLGSKSTTIFTCAESIGMQCC